MFGDKQIQGEEWFVDTGINLKTNQVEKYGKVSVLAVMGGDRTPARAARISYNSGKSLHNDIQLTKYLYANKHTSPFEMAEMVFRIRAPIFVTRQWLRHRTASVNEMSGRYSTLPPWAYLPDVFNEQATTNKQGSGGMLGDIAFQKQLRQEYLNSVKTAYRTYSDLLDAGVAKEQARLTLPVSMYTEFIWKMDLKNLLDFLALRLHPHAQRETRKYAAAIALSVKKHFPEIFKIFVETRMTSLVLFGTEAITAANELSNDGVKDVISATTSKSRKAYLRQKFEALEEIALSGDVADKQVVQLLEEVQNFQG